MLSEEPAGHDREDYRQRAIIEAEHGGRTTSPARCEGERPTRGTCRFRGTTSCGKTLGRPTALDTSTIADVIQAYRDGTAIKALARQHQVAPKTIRRMLDSAGARQLPDQLDAPPAPEQQPGCLRTRR